MRLASCITVALMTFDKQSNAGRTAVESKSNRSCNRRITDVTTALLSHCRSSPVGVAAAKSAAIAATDCSRRIVVQSTRPLSRELCSAPAATDDSELSNRRKDPSRALRRVEYSIGLTTVRVYFANVSGHYFQPLVLCTCTFEHMDNAMAPDSSCEHG